MNKLINTDELQFVGRGAESCVYVHPGHSNRCIKICHTNSQTRSYKVLLWKARNQAKYVKHMHTKFANPPIPQYFGQFMVRHQGKELPAFCYQLIRDADGEISKPISHPQTLARADLGRLLAAVDALFIRLLAVNFACSFQPGNLLVQFTAADFNLVMVDEIGLKSLWHPCHWIAPYGRFRTRRKYFRDLRHFHRIQPPPKKRPPK